jgi:hypothetical protein
MTVCPFCFAPLENGATFCSDECEDGAWKIVPTLDGEVFVPEKGSTAGAWRVNAAPSERRPPRDVVITIPGPAALDQPQLQRRVETPRK